MRDGARSILTTKREIKELREHAELETAALARLREDAGGLDVDIAAVESAIASLQAELHRQEKAIVGFELQVGERRRSGRARLAASRSRSRPSAGRAEEELRTQEARQEEARESIQRIESEQRAADEQLSAAQRRLFEARETARPRPASPRKPRRRTPRSSSARSALAIEVQRLEEAARELEERAVARAEDLQRNGARREELRVDRSQRPSASSTQDCARSTICARQVRVADEASQTLRAAFDTQEQTHPRGAPVARRRSRRGRAARRRARDRRIRPEPSRCVLRRDRAGARSTRSPPRSRRWRATGLLASPRPVDDAPDAAEVEDETGARRGGGDGRQPVAAPAHADAGRDGRRPARQDRAHGRRQHDGDRSVRRPRVAPHVPDRAAQGPRRFDRGDQRGDPADRQDHARALPGSVHGHQPELRAARSRRSSAAAGPAWSCSTRATRSRAASTSSRSRRASGSRACSSCRAARRR